MKIAFIGAGSCIFARNVLGDCILTPEIGEFDIALHDINAERLEDSRRMICSINRNMNGKAHVVASVDRREMLKDADYVVNAIQVGGYKPCTVTDIEVPKKYGLRQTIGDTLGIGGIFRALRTIPVMEDIAGDMEELCPNALLINYTNPMAIITGFMQRYTGVKTIGLCHSVQTCVPHLLSNLGMQEYIDTCRWKIAGINHQAWLLSVEDQYGNDLYPEIKRRSQSGEYVLKYGLFDGPRDWDIVRHEMMKQFGYYLTESSEHSSEYLPYFIKSQYPELLDRYKIPLDEILVRYDLQEEDWKNVRNEVVHNDDLTHTMSHEYASDIIKAMITNRPFCVHGNVQNTGLITNLPDNACVEVACMVNRNGINPCYFGKLPEHLAALNRLNINMQLLTIQAAHTRKKEDIYYAAMLDPRLSAELPIDQIKALVDDMIEAHGKWLPAFR